ncbi:MAG TPA: carboxylating nicotinate-nucleotide diphosphorylase [Epulopiscium sp.]|nr:carboxylating nicotinate-nucleotide diphosphorylase [Candidatus Epulonipiscium sp.]
MINNINMSVSVENYLRSALKEDITSEDVTTNAILQTKTMGSANLICREDGIISGLEVFKKVFSLLGSIRFLTTYKDGDQVRNGDVIGTITGDMRIILSGERTALNYLQRMSGISTLTNKLVQALEGTNTKLLDTRKTTPNMRLFEKYAVKVGGGLNHRYNLSDGILLKDNHIGAAGSITKAIELAREYAPFVRKIEVEVETLDMVKEALDARADIIMLDNMDHATMREAVLLIGDKALTECSGNVTLDRLKEISATGVDFVSCGALTHSSPILDFSLKNLKPL